MSFLEITHKTEGPVQILQLAGRLDNETAEQFKACIFQLINNGHRQLVLNMAGLTYLNAAGLRAMQHAHESLLAENENQTPGLIYVAQPADRSAKVLELVGFNTLFSIFPNQELAVQSILGLQTTVVQLATQVNSAVGSF